MATPTPRSEPYRRKKTMWRKLRYEMVNWLQKAPFVWKPLSWGRKIQKRATIRMKALLALWSGRRNGYYGNLFDVERILWINPQGIIYSSCQEFSASDFKGRVIGGDWDHLAAKFDDFDICAAIREVCREEKPWHTTVFYQRAVARLNEGLTTWGCRDLQSFERRCTFLESLYTSIRNDGYKTQAELANLNLETRVKKPEEEEIGINIGRHGDLLFSDGGHRLAISKVLGLKKIPVKVIVRHIGWAELRKGLLDYTNQHDVQSLPPFPHPDLGDIPCNQEYAHLYDMIQKDLQNPNSIILDIGAQFGYFCHRFEEQGATCFALEENQEDLQYLRTLRRASNRKFTILENYLALDLLANKNLDAVLLLNSFSRMEDSPEQLAKLETWLKKLSFQRLFVMSKAKYHNIKQMDLAKSYNRSGLTHFAGQLGLTRIEPRAQLNGEITLFTLW